MFVQSLKSISSNFLIITSFLTELTAREKIILQELQKRKETVLKEIQVYKSY